MKTTYSVIISLLMAMGVNAYAQEESTGTETVQEQQEMPQEQKETLPTNAEETYKDIEKTLGFVPQFMKEFPKEGITGAWIEMKQLEMGETNLDQKHKQLVSLAVAAQIPCDYCVSYHTAMAKANGASEAEIKESVGLAAGVRHWSTALNGLDIDKKQFEQDVQKIVNQIEKQKLAE